MTKERMQELVHLLNEYLIDHAGDELGNLIAKVRHAVHSHERKLVGICPWCLEEYRKPHPQCRPGKPKKQEPLTYGEESEDEGADG